MKAVLLSLLLLVALSNCQVIPPNPVFNAVSSGANNTGTADNCLYQFWRFDASSATGDSYLFITVTDFVADPNQGVAFYVGKGFTPTAATNTAQCTTLNGNNNCILRLDCAFTPAIYTFVTTEVWGAGATNSTCKFNFTVTLATINPIALGTVANLPSHRASSNITSTANDPFPPQWDHYTLTVSLLPQVFQGADLVINITDINGHGTPVTPFTGFLKAGHFTEGSAGTDCSSLLTCTAAVAPNTFCSFRIPYCSIVAGNYYLALKKELDGSSNWDYNITAYWDTRTVTPLTLGTAKYDEISDWAMEKYYSFSTTGLDEITVNVYDVAGGKLHWGASQTYVVTSTPGTCSNVMGCSTPYADACRDQYHFCPSPSATTTTNWFVTVRTDSRIPDNTRNRDFISYVIKATATSRTTKALNSPQFAVTGAVDQERYDYYSFSVPAVIVNETFYIELYVDSTEDEAQLNKNYLMDNTLYAGPLLNVSGNVCQNLDWSCRTNQTSTTGNQRCYLQIPTCKLIPGTTIYFSVYGIKSQFYGIPVSYTLFGGLNTPMQLKDGISYQDQTNVNSYVHYLYRYSQTDLTPGDALLIEVTNIKQSTTTNVYVSFRNNLAGDCPCYQYDYFCQDAQECLFDTYQLFGGAGCKGLVPQDIYISVLGVTDAGLPNIGYTITITKYNWAGPINNLVAGNLVSGYVSDSENVYYWLDTSTITAAAPLMEFEVRFVEYIKNGNNDNEALTLYAMKDNLLTPTCAPFTCTTPRYTTTNGFSYCKVVLQPCQFDKSKNWYLVVRGSGGLTKGRAIHYTITANPVAVTPTTLANGVVVPGVVEYGQIQHYKYSVANNNNNRLYIEMYMDKDFARFVEFKVNFNYLASGSMCYNYTGSCTVITDYKTKCVYHIPNCQIQVGDYYFGVHLLNDFYDRPVPFTIAVYEKQEIIPIGDATDPAFGPVFTKLQRGEYQLFMFDATTGVNPGDIVYFEVDQVEHGNLTVVSSVDTPRGYCPCYGPIGSNTILDTTLSNYSLFNLACKGQRKFYFYLQPGVFYEESYIAFSVAIYVNRPPLAATLQKTQPLGVNGTTTKYTHRYFTIPQNAAAANSLIIYHFQTYNLTAPYAVLYGGKSYVNDKCGVTPLVDSPVQTMIQTLKPCDHTLDKNSYYFDVTATTNVSYAFNLWYDQIDPIPVAFNVTTNGSIPVTDNHYDQLYVITPTIAVGSILKIRFTNFVSTATSQVMVTRNSIYDGSCTCADATPKGTLDQAAGGKLDIDIPYCDVTVGTYPFYITVKANGAVANYTLRWFVWNPVVTTINPLGNAGFFNTSAALTNVGDMAFYKLIIPASTASSGPYYWSVSIDTTTWALGNNFDLWVTTDGSSITLSTSCNLNLNCGGGNDGTCKVEECCVSGSAPAPLYITISAKNAGVTYNLNSLIAARFTPIVPITLNGPNVTQNVVSSGFGLTRVSGIKSDSIAIMKITAANYTGAPNVYQTQEQYQFPATNAGCLPPGNQLCTTPGFAAGACTEILECPKSQYTVSYNTLDAVVNTYNIAWQEVPAVALTLNPASPRNYTVTQDLIGKTVQFYVDLAGTQYDDLSDTLYINITTARGTFTNLDAYYNPATPAFATGTTGCTGGVTSFCTIAPGNDCAPKALQGCDVVPRGRIYIGVKLSDNTGSFLIGVYLVQLPRNPLQPTNNVINGGTPAYWLYTYSGQVSYLDMTFNSIQPAIGMTNSYSLWDSCASATPMLVDATKVRLYPCVLNNPPTSNGKVYFTTTSTQAQSNYTFTLAAPGVTVLPLDTTNTFYNTVDKDATYIYYSLVLPVLQPFQRVDVTFTVSCGSMYVLENWNSIAWPDAFPPTGSPSPATCYRGFQNIDASTLAQATFTYSYSYCNWGPDRADRTIYYTVQGNTRLYTSLTQFTVVAKIAGTPPTMIQLPMRQDYLHNAVSNVIYWFETQTQAVGTQIYVRVSAPTNANIERLYGPWFEDASCEHSEMTMNNELWSGVAAYGWGDNGQTDCATASGITTCTYVIYPSEYRDGRYYIKLDSTAMGQQVRFFVWVERQGAVAITNDWSAYGSLGLKREYQYYAISTAGHSYVTIKVWNVTDGTLSLFLPEYQTAPFGGNPNQLYGRGATLGSYEATDSADTWDVTTGQYLVVPLGVCYFCTPYIYVAVRAKTFAVTTINTTVTYNIQFKFATPMAIPNDTVVCDTTNFKANETAYQLLLDWEDIWVVTAWTPNGEQYFHYDLQPTTQNLVAAFSPTGPSSQNSPTPGSDRCGYLTSQQSTFTTPSVGSYEDKCANNKFFISVISSAAAVASTYYLHPVVYNYPVAAYTLGTTYSGVGCGQTVYLKVPTTADATSYLNVDVTGTVTVKMNYGAVPDSSCASQDVRTMNPGNFNFADLCYLKTGTLYIVVTTTASNGPWTLTASVVTPPSSALAVGGSVHNFIGSKPYLHSVAVTPNPGQSLVISAYTQWNGQQVKITVAKDGVKNLLCGGTPWTATSTGSTPATVTLTPCDTAAATYYVSVEAPSSCSSTSILEYWITASLTTAYTPTVLTNAAPLVISTPGSGTNTNYFTFTPTGGSFLAVKLRKPTSTASATSLKLRYTAGNVVGYVPGPSGVADTCNWYTSVLLCTVNSYESGGLVRWCTAEVPPCSFSTGKLYGFSVTASDGSIAHSYELTVTQQTFTALTGAPQPSSIAQDANYYQITTTSVAALGIKLTVSSGTVEARVYTYCGNYDCNQYDQTFRCDQYEGECRLEFANAVSHPLSLTYYVKVSGTATYTIAALTGTTNNLAAGAFASNLFCYPISNNYSTWNYKNFTERDAEAKRLYNRWISTGKWNCPSQTCLKALQALACYYMFPAADFNGFLYDVCQSNCQYATQACGGNFTWAGFPEFDCANHFYKPAPFCTGAFPGCDGVPGSGKKYDICGVCGGTGSSCTTSTTSNPTTVNPSTTSNPTTINPTTTGNATTTLTTLSTTTGVTANATTTAKTTTTTTTTATTTSKATTTTTTSVGPTTSTTSPSVSAAFTAKPVLIFVMFAALVLLFLQA